MKKALDRLAKILPPAWSARLDYMSSHRRFFYPWGFAMNGQVGRLEIVRRLLTEFGVKRIVETGSFRGTTTEWLAGFGLPVQTVEIVRRYHYFTRRRLAKQKNVELFLGDSIGFLRDLARGPHTRARTFFYLDAHWHDHLPLAEEMQIIHAAFPEAIVMIDDFQVPDDTGYGYDDYGPGKALTLGYLAPVLPPTAAAWFPVAASAAETGARRGSVVIAWHPEIVRALDTLPVLRRRVGSLLEAR